MEGVIAASDSPVFFSKRKRPLKFQKKTKLTQLCLFDAAAIAATSDHILSSEGLIDLNTLFALPSTSS
jgi:hypothetical protein